MLYIMTINPPVYVKTNTNTVVEYKSRSVTFHLLQGDRGATRIQGPKGRGSRSGLVLIFHSCPLDTLVTMYDLIDSYLYNTTRFVPHILISLPDTLCSSLLHNQRTPEEIEPGCQQWRGTTLSEYRPDFSPPLA